jgi:polyphosphate glucokinase
MKKAAKKTSGRMPTVLAVDIGGSHVKAMTSKGRIKRAFDSGPDLTGREMVRRVRELTNDWPFDCISIGYPGVVAGNRVVREPWNLGRGWKGVDFGKAFGKPTKVVNDALMQALGGYQGGRMLFLGLGTGMGAAMILDGTLVPMELGHLPYQKKTFEDYVGADGLKRHGRKKWRLHVADVVERLIAALQPDYVLLGGGNVDKLDRLPPKCRRGDNRDAFEGGFRLWDEKAKTQRARRKPRIEPGLRR